MDLVDMMNKTAISFQFLIMKRSQDGEFDEKDINDTIANIDEIKGALECELAKIDEARQAARSHSADKTSEKI